MATKIVNFLAGLPAEVTVKKLVHRSNYKELWISFPKSERVCPHCVSYDCTIKDSGRDSSVIITTDVVIIHTTICSLRHKQPIWQTRNCLRKFLVASSLRSLTMYGILLRSPPQINSSAHAAETLLLQVLPPYFHATSGMASSNTSHHTAFLHRHLSLTDKNAVSQSCHRRKRRIGIYRLLHPRSDQL